MKSQRISLYAIRLISFRWIFKFRYKQIRDPRKLIINWSLFFSLFSFLKFWSFSFAFLPVHRFTNSIDISIFFFFPLKSNPWILLAFFLRLDSSSSIYSRLNFWISICPFSRTISENKFFSALKTFVVLQMEERGEKRKKLR